MTKHEDTTPGEPLALRLSEGLGPLVEELAHRTAWRYARSRDPHHSDTYTFNRTCLLDFADKLVAAALERIAGEPPISGNTLAQARVLMAAAQFKGPNVRGNAPDTALQTLVEREEAARRGGSR
jgi:hypothetical protein